MAKSLAFRQAVLADLAGISGLTVYPWARIAEKRATPSVEVLSSTLNQIPENRAMQTSQVERSYLLRLTVGSTDEAKLEDLETQSDAIADALEVQGSALNVACGFNVYVEWSSPDEPGEGLDRTLAERLITLTFSAKYTRGSA